MDHDERVRQEFTRQSGHFASAAKIADVQLTQRFVDAVAPEPGWRVLDVACGPGLVTAALAPHVREVVALDLTPEMLNKARQRCAAAGAANILIQQGSAADLPFEANSFDAVVTRLSLHHFENPALPLSEMARVLRQGGRFVVADVISSEEPEESALHNAIEILRDPSHVRMLPASELLALLADAGLEVVRQTAWDIHREFEEWAQIVDDPVRIAPVRIIARTMAKLGQHAGIGLSLAGGRIVFFHRWLLVVSRKPGERRSFPKESSASAKPTLDMPLVRMGQGPERPFARSLHPDLVSKLEKAGPHQLLGIVPSIVEAPRQLVLHHLNMVWLRSIQSDFGKADRRPVFVVGLVDPSFP